LRINANSIDRRARTIPRGALGLGLALLFALGAQGQATRFTPPSAETFSGKKAAEDVLRSLQIDARAARDPLALLGLKMNDLVTHWHWGEALGTAPPTVELHFENDARAVIAAPSGALLGYLRYATNLIAKDPPKHLTPGSAPPKEDALAEVEAAAKVEEWIAKFLPAGSWRTGGLEYKDHHDITPGDLYGTWWIARAARIHLGYPARGVDVVVALDAASGELMQLQVPVFDPPRDAAIYFPVENARIKAEDYLSARPGEALAELILRDPNAPDQFLPDPNPTTRAERRRERKMERAIAEGDTAKVEALQADGDGSGAGPLPNPTPPTLAPGNVDVVLAPVSFVWSQAQWKPLSDTSPTPQFMLVYAFPTQTPTAPTGAIYVTTAGNEVVR